MSDGVDEVRQWESQPFSRPSRPGSRLSVPQDAITPSSRRYSRNSLSMNSNPRYFETSSPGPDEGGRGRASSGRDPAMRPTGVYNVPVERDAIGRHISYPIRERRPENAEEHPDGPPKDDRDSHSHNRSECSTPSVASTGYLKYNDLKDGEIRLIKVLPPTKSTIRCVTESVLLRHSGKYIALSYTWGDDDKRSMVEINGCETPITSSLYGALKRLRSQTEPVMLWVDAVCINQLNPREKSRQIPLMTEIYGRAESVAVWLGLESDDSEKAMVLLQKLANCRDHDAGMALISSERWRPHFPALVSLFERPYWNRLWVVQEVLIALSTSYVTVYCGK
jgi:hypothetical protein